MHSSIAIAQTTEFTYQGGLLDASLSANAIYDFEFRVFAVETGRRGESLFKLPPALAGGWQSNQEALAEQK